MLQDACAAPRRIAIIGGGIAGMAAAHRLAPHHHVVLCEAATRLGGHARTVMAGRRGDQPVDTGFIVFNKTNYPGLTALFSDLDVPIVESDMSFGVSARGGRLEYGLRSLGTLFAQRRNAADPRFLGMIRDILRFNSRALALAQDPAMTIRELLEALGTGDWFRDYYILPFSGAIWSTPVRDVLDFPAMAMLRFFANHALLGVSGQHQWYTVRGGSVEYVRRLEAALKALGVEIRLGAPIMAVRRGPRGPELRGIGGTWELFDEVVFATHSDDTLRLLSDATGPERAALAAIRYQPNEAMLHADPSVMPQRRKVWSSWVYTDAGGRPTDRIGLTYWMNSLQPIPEDDPLFVTLNATAPIRDDLIHDSVTFRHPVYDTGALRAQQELRGMNGKAGTWFCGAWMKNGFHEDGLSSALDVAAALLREQAARVAA
ncbi:NAD(P)/FAD-dependent oxidoreductase [Plastorhodobacter daqingensis]|uniref:NAD(P)/FAD-dependent oxidoreductase n=1 Tax=Plastorhodobacter daqingensis TaxID=1387281 RepID=A0ABW2ULY6_9RHOB